MAALWAHRMLQSFGFSFGTQLPPSSYPVIRTWVSDDESTGTSKIRNGRQKKPVSILQK